MSSISTSKRGPVSKADFDRARKLLERNK
jgi:hypothetical protein